MPQSKPKLYWPAPYAVEGNGFGYSVHAKMMRAEAEKYFDLCNEADVALSISSADRWTPVAGRYNFLFTMFESLDTIPFNYSRNIQQADHIIVPANFLVPIFERYTNVPISVCHEGVNSNIFTYIKREMPIIKPFRWLWVGAPNPRKGTAEISAICQLLHDMPQMEFYLLSSVTGQYEEKGNVIFDSRRHTLEELVQIYHDAHGFIFPSMGEGWGLTLTEAMSTGAPCITPIHTGIADYADDYTCYPCKWTPESMYLSQYVLEAKFARCDCESIVNQMTEIYSHYKDAVIKGRKASERIQRFYTWETAGLRLRDILHEVYFDRENYNRTTFYDGDKSNDIISRRRFRKNECG